MTIDENGQIGPYRLRGVLGRGGSATVYRGYDPGLGREVAVKVMTLKEGQGPILRERFRREALAVARLRHPNIITVYTAGEDRGIPYLAMELFPGGSLARHLGRPLAVADAASVVRQIGGALDYAHAQGFLHRDIKPANIFIDGQRAILADFGIVKALGGDEHTNLTETGLTVGTPEYIAPEQALGETIDGRADIYALAVVLYEMVTGVPPYGGSTFEVLNGHVAGKIPDPRRRNPALSAALGTVLLKALARYPEGRYPTGAAFAAALDRALAQETAPGQAPALDASGREARTLIIDLQREQLAETHYGMSPQPLSGDQTIITPLGASAPTTNDSLPALPNLTPQGVDPRATPPPEAPLHAPRPMGNEATIIGDFQLPAAPQPTSQPPPQQPIVQQPVYQQPPANYPPPAYPPVAPQPFVAPVSPRQERRSRAPLWFGLLALVLVALLFVGVGGWWLIGRGTGATPTATVGARGSTTTAQASSTAAAVAGTATARVAGGGVATPGSGGSATSPIPANDPARPQIEAGDRALQDGRFTEAIASYRAGLQTNPDSATANRQLGLTLWVWNHDAGEVDYLARATKLAPDDALAWAYLSFSSVDTHQVERAYAAAQQAVRADPQRAEAYAAVANTYLRYPPDTNDPAASLRTAQEATDKAKALDPNGIWTLWVETQLLQSLNQDEVALAPLDRLIAQRPNWPTLYYAKGGIYRSLDRPADARDWQNRALALDPDYPYALTELGWLAYDDGDYDGAIDFFTRALRMTDDTNDFAHVGFGWSLAAKGDYTNALARCRRAVQIDGRAPLGYQCLGSVYLDGPKNYDESLANYRKVIELRPQWENGYVGIAAVHSARQNYAAAEAILREGVPKVTAPRFIHYWLGLALYQQRKYDQAQPEFEQAAQQRPENAVIQYLLGENLEALGRYPEARAAYERALSLDPNNQQARGALDRLTQQGR